MHLDHTCKNCGNSFKGNFCNTCGEKFYTDNDKSVKHLAEEALHFITHFDTKFFTTIRSVLFKTGIYSLDYAEGKRKKYFKPVSLFLIIVILYLIFPKFKGLNMNFDTYSVPQYGYAFLAKPVVQAKLAAGLSIDAIRAHYNETSPKFAKFLLLLFLPLTAVTFKALFFRRRKYFFDHFILAAELNTFFIALVFLLLPLLMTIIATISKESVLLFADGGIILSAAGVVLLLVTIIAFRRFYGEKWGWCTIKAIIFFLVFNYVIKFIYNSILFLLVMLFVH
jgi:hypothetical protein